MDGVEDGDVQRLARLHAAADAPARSGPQWAGQQPVQAHVVVGDRGEPLREAVPLVACWRPPGHQPADRHFDRANAQQDVKAQLQRALESAAGRAVNALADGTDDMAGER